MTSQSSFQTNAPIKLTSVGLRLATALQFPDDWGGAALVCRNVARYMKATGQMSTDSFVLEWVSEANIFSAALNQASEDHVGLITNSAVMRGIPVFGSLLEPIRSTLSEAQTQAIHAEIGRVIIGSCCAAASVPASIVSGFATLLRSGEPRARRSHEWSELAGDFPASTEHLERWIDKAAFDAVCPVYAAQPLLQAPAGPWHAGAFPYQL